MKNIKKIFVIVFVLFISVILTGCSNKKSITSSEFYDIMSGEGFNLTDATEQFGENNSLNKVYVAQDKNYEYQVEFYEFKTDSDAISSYNINKDEFENSKTGNSSQSEIGVKNYNKYTLKSGGTYKLVSRIDNTMIYVDVEENNEKNIKDILKKLGDY